ncbi:MAG: hypothetical protein P1V97_09745, partial [Planctomycetota bacterium]|nr:hypothetical protein [Planctomycetota bacterium]
FSIICSRTRSASGMTFLFFLMFFVSPYLAIAVLKTFHLDHEQGFFIEAFMDLIEYSVNWNIAISFKNILSTDFKNTFINPQIISNVIFGLLFFLLGTRSFSFFNSGQPVKAAQRSVLLTRRSMLTNKRRRVWSSALLWKEFFFLSGGPPIFVAKIIGYSILCALVFGALAYQNLNITSGGVPLMVIFASVAFIEIGLLAGRVFREELKWQTWPTLTLLPMSVDRLYYRKILGASLSLAPIFFFIVFSGLLNTSETMYFINKKQNLWLIFYLIGVTVLFANGVVMISLYARQGAFALSLGMVVTLNMVLLFAIEKFSRMHGLNWKPDNVLKVLLFVNLALSLLFHLRSRKRLKDLVSIG